MRTPKKQDGMICSAIARHPGEKGGTLKFMERQYYYESMQHPFLFPLVIGVILTLAAVLLNGQNLASLGGDFRLADGYYSCDCSIKEYVDMWKSIRITKPCDQTIIFCSESTCEATETQFTNDLSVVKTIIPGHCTPLYHRL